MSKHLALPVTLASGLLLSACASSVARTSPHEGPARLSETVHVDGPSVRPDRVIEDSRCPENARCVWAGRVVLRATISGGNWRKTVDLTMGQPVQVADGALTLVSVTPERHAGGTGQALDYRFAFTFQGGL